MVIRNYNRDLLAAAISQDPDGRELLAKRSESVGLVAPGDLDAAFDLAALPILRKLRGPNGGTPSNGLEVETPSDSMAP